MPMRILLIGAAVFLAAWFTVLKPGGATEEIPPVTPANTTPAQPAADGTANAAATPAAAEDTAVADTAIPAEVLAKLPRDVAKAIKARKTLVLGVFTDYTADYRPMADDDRYVRNALEKTNRYKGEVFAKNVSVGDLVDFAPLVNDLGVKQTPAVVVIDRDLKGTVLTGYVDRVAINQAIADARRASIDPYITDEFLRDVNAVCTRFNLRETRFSLPTINGKKAEIATIKRGAKLDRQWIAAVARVDAPAKWKGLKAHYLRVLRRDLAGINEFLRLYKADKPLPSSTGKLIDLKDARKLDERFDDAGLTACAINRRS